MNTKVCNNYIFILSFLFLAIFIGLIINNIISNNNNNKNTIEPFVPIINKFYRPYFRNMRTFTTEGLKNVSHHKNKLFRRFGLI